uniref:F-box domain-containing protein n=1 Tax=Panagrellus redivivus TaxID=6233 RepID=A0A7E4ZWR1_PANRE
MEYRPPPLKLGKKVHNVSSAVNDEISYPLVYDQVFITDNDNIALWASKETFLFRLFHTLHRFAVLRIIIDAFFEINPTWQVVLCVDAIIDKKLPIYVRDTVVLHCNSTNSYEQIIPFICGPYTRLTLHGNLTVDQVKQLVNSSVKKVRINARMEVPKNSYDDFTEFVANQVCVFNPCFTICNENLTPELIEKLDKACYLRKRLPLLDVEVGNKKFYVTHSRYFIFVFIVTFLFVSLQWPILYFGQGKLLIRICIFYPFLFISMLISGLLGAAFIVPYSIPKMDCIDPSVVQTNDWNGLVYALVRAMWKPIDTMSTVSNDQLKSHLLRQVTHIILDKIRRRPLPIRHLSPTSWIRTAHEDYQRRHEANTVHFTTLLVSGKEPAELLRALFSQRLHISETFTLFVELCHDKFELKIFPPHLRNMVLRWTQFLEIESFHNSGQLIPDPKQIPDWVYALRLFNNIEELTLAKPEDPSQVIALVEGCSNLAILKCPPDVLDLLLEHIKTPFSKLHTIETTHFCYDWSKIFKHLTNHPEQCPVLETLTMLTNKFDIKKLSKSARQFSIPTVKSFNFTMEADCCTAVSFSTLTPIFAAFPNLETASLTLDVECEHRTPKLPLVYKSFEKFNPKVEFTFTYILKHVFNHSDEELDRLETRLGALGTITSVVQEGNLLTYSVTTSYPKKTMKLEVLIEEDSEDESCEDSEVEDYDDEDSEEDY